MTKLDKLIQELCPDGVKYLPIPELFITRNGYTPSKANSEFWENGTIPWFRMEDIRENGRILTTATQYVSEKAVKGKLFPADSIIIATSATIGEHALIKVPSLANQRFTYLTLKDEFKDCVDMMFVFYYCFRLDEYCKSHLNQGNFASVDMKQFAAFKFPVPPLPVQREIVRILDNFTELTEGLNRELAAELTARKKQYAYYRDKLLHNDATTVYKRLGDFCDLLSGFPFDSSKFKEDGIRLMRGMNIKRGYLDFTEENNRYWESTDCVEEYLLNDQDIVISMDGSLVGSSYGMVSKKDLPLLLVQRVTRIRTNQANIRYVYHYIASGRFTEYVHKKKTAGAIPHISLKDISNFEVPLPSLEIQKRLVEVLDNFDALCTDLNIGLPAEIEARKKQYEFYRDQLLTFAAQGETILTDRQTDRQTDEYSALIRLCQYVFGYVSIELGSIGKVSMCKRIMKAETSPDGDVPFYKIGTFGKKPDAYISREKFEEYRKAYSFPKKGDVLISAAGTIGRTVIYDGEDAYYQDSNIVWIDNDESVVLNRYLFYCYQLQPWAVSEGGTIARLYNDNISRAKISVPSIEEQKRIIAILDRFDTLCIDLSSGLPAEIEARQKQYEYYRDKLLTFTPAD